MQISGCSTLLALAGCVSIVGGQYYPVTGVQTGRGQSGSRPLRRNILNLQNDTPTFSLYIQALARMQATSENDQLSWFQIAGIHGRPYIPWNRIGNTPGAPRTGYCTHTSPLFATWHRPYLVLFEQVLAGHVQAIAKTYPTASIPTYQIAADNFRIPYWDWGINSNVPPVVNAQKVQIYTPSGVKLVDNPLLTYRFQALGGFNGIPRTVRDPASTVDSRLLSEGLQRRTWQSIAKSPNFNSFSTAATPGSSVEAVHNSIHGDIGQQMGQLAYSAFDPVFWLHHANVDRLFAMYQAINPNNYLVQMYEPQGTFTIRVNNLDDVDTPLSPFTSDAVGTIYTSFTSRSLAPFGYSYPEIQDWTQTTDDLRKNCTAQFNTMYNPTSTFTKRAMKNIFTPGSRLRTWSVAVSVSKLDLQTRFIVRVFLGEPPLNPMDWFTSTSVVGSLFVVQPSNAGNDFEPPQQIVVHDEFDLEEGLLAHGYDGQDVGVLRKYLRNGLQWRIQDYDGTVIPTEGVPSLKVAVQAEIVTLAKSITELPIYSAKTIYPDITKRKIGGYAGSAAG